MALAMSITSVQAAGQQLRVTFKLAASGNYSTGGDTVNFATATQDPLFQGMIAAIEALGAPLYMSVQSNSGNIANLYFPVLGTGPTNNKLKIISAYNTELSAGPYPGGVTGDTIVGEAIFAKL